MTLAKFTTMIALSAALAMAMTAAAQTPKSSPTAKSSPKQTPKAPAGRGRGVAATTPALSAAAKAKLMNPAALKDVAPAEFRATFDTSAGPFVVLVHRSWAPKGADRFYNLVKYGFFNNARFFRASDKRDRALFDRTLPTIQSPRATSAERWCSPTAVRTRARRKCSSISRTIHS